RPRVDGHRRLGRGRGGSGPQLLAIPSPTGRGWGGGQSFPLIREACAGKTILITGTTGYLGKSLVEKLLRSLPEVGRINVAIRPSARRPPRERLEREVLASPCFKTLKAEIGEDAFRKLAADKLHLV